MSSAYFTASSPIRGYNQLTMIKGANVLFQGPQIITFKPRHMSASEFVGAMFAIVDNDSCRGTQPSKRFEQGLQETGFGHLAVQCTFGCHCSVKCQWTPLSNVPGFLAGLTAINCQSIAFYVQIQCGDWPASMARMLYRVCGTRTTDLCWHSRCCLACPFRIGMIGGASLRFLEQVERIAVETHAHSMHLACAGMWKKTKNVSHWSGCPLRSTLFGPSWLLQLAQDHTVL